MGEAVEVGAGELPLEWGGDPLVAAAECEQSLFERVEVGEVVGGEDFALDDGEVDLSRADFNGDRVLWFPIFMYVSSRRVLV